MSNIIISAKKWDKYMKIKHDDLTVIVKGNNNNSVISSELFVKYIDVLEATLDKIERVKFDISKYDMVTLRCLIKILR